MPLKNKALPQSYDRRKEDWHFFMKWGNIVERRP